MSTLRAKGRLIKKNVEIFFLFSDFNVLINYFLEKIIRGKAISYIKI